MILFYNRWEGGGRRESLEIENPMTASPLTDMTGPFLSVKFYSVGEFFQKQ